MHSTALQTRVHVTISRERRKRRKKKNNTCALFAAGSREGGDAVAGEGKAVCERPGGTRSGVAVVRLGSSPLRHARGPGAAVATACEGGQRSCGASEGGR